MSAIQRISPCLWFDDQAEQAAEHYTAIFDGSRILSIQRYTEVGREFHGKQPGAVMTVAFELDGQRFTALNGGPTFTFSEAVSFQVHCRTQDEVDYYWERLCDGGSEQMCGWLKDRFGVSWQVIPTEFLEMISDSDPERVRRITEAMFQMQKLHLPTLRRAYAG